MDIRKDKLEKIADTIFRDGDSAPVIAPEASDSVDTLDSMKNAV